MQHPEISKLLLRNPREGTHFGRVLTEEERPGTGVTEGGWTHGDTLTKGGTHLSQCWFYWPFCADI